MSERCSKAGCENERAGKHRWCRGCQAAARKARRGQPDVSNVSNVGVQPVSNVQPDVQRARPLDMARRRIGELEDEVARYKRDLAAAHAKLDAMVKGLPTRPPEVVAAPRGGKVLTPPKEATPGHPPGQCYKTVCWCKA